jgi:hypothetical protein
MLVHLAGHRDVLAVGRKAMVDPLAPLERQQHRAVRKGLA